jgi:hypothetical protein
MTTSVIQVSDWKLRERKILNFQYQNWPTEENIELEDSEYIIKIVCVFTLLACIFGNQFFFTLATKI